MLSLVTGGNYSRELGLGREAERRADGSWKPFSQVIQEMEDADKREAAIRSREIPISIRTVL